MHDDWQRVRHIPCRIGILRVLRCSITREIPTHPYKGAHYATWPPALVVPLVKSMCPQRVCRECGEPSRRITEAAYSHDASHANGKFAGERYGDNAPEDVRPGAQGMAHGRAAMTTTTLGWTDCHHDNYRPGQVLDPFAGSGTTLAVASGHGLDSVGIDLDPRNADLAYERIGGLLLEIAHV